MADTIQQAARPASEPETWVDQYGDYLYRFAMIRVRDPHAAEELVQEALVAAFQSRQRFAGKSSERSWLTGILKHKISDQFRKTARERPVEDIHTWGEEAVEPFGADGHWRAQDGAGPIDWGADASSALMQKEFFDALSQCLSKLPRRIAEAFTLRELEEQNTAEICQVLNITPTNLWVMLHRARIQLRQCLEVNWFERKERASS